ncbi:MAG: hypothetical protein AAB408_02720 [Patescibacteria group bacterium]
MFDNFCRFEHLELQPPAQHLLQEGETITLDSAEDIDRVYANVAERRPVPVRWPLLRFVAGGDVKHNDPVTPATRLDGVDEVACGLEIVPDPTNLHMRARENRVETILVTHPRVPITAVRDHSHRQIIDIHDFSCFAPRADAVGVF